MTRELVLVMALILIIGCGIALTSVHSRTTAAKKPPLKIDVSEVCIDGVAYYATPAYGGHYTLAPKYAKYDPRPESC